MAMQDDIFDLRYHLKEEGSPFLEVFDNIKKYIGEVETENIILKKKVSVLKNAIKIISIE